MCFTPAARQLAQRVDRELSGMLYTYKLKTFMII